MGFAGTLVELRESLRRNFNTPLGLERRGFVASLGANGYPCRWVFQANAGEFVFSAGGSYAILAARRWPSRLHVR